MVQLRPFIYFNLLKVNQSHNDFHLNRCGFKIHSKTWIYQIVEDRVACILSFTIALTRRMVCGFAKLLRSSLHFVYFQNVLCRFVHNEMDQWIKRLIRELTIHSRWKKISNQRVEEHLIYSSVISNFIAFIEKIVSKILKCDNRYLTQTTGNIIFEWAFAFIRFRTSLVHCFYISVE